MNKGVSFLEVIISISIIGIITFISSQVFISISNNKSLDADVSKLISAFEKARNLSISGSNASEHGVSVSSSSVIVFRGTSISANNHEVEYNFSKGSLTSINFIGGGSSIYFNKLTGKPSTTGTMVMTSGNSSTTISVFASGLVE